MKLSQEELKRANKILSNVLQGLKRACNHCQVLDCDVCWQNDICEQIIEHFESSESNQKERK